MRLLILVMIVGLFVSCDKRKDLFQENNQPVSTVLQLENGHSAVSATYVDQFTVRDTLKLNQTYRFSLKIIDEDGFSSVEFSGDGAMEVNGNAFTSSDLTNGIHEFEWTADTTGVKSFSLKITDTYGEVVQYDFSLFVFYNIVPNIWWEVIDDGSLGPLHKRIRVHGGDGDDLYGGDIIYCRFVIDSDTTDFPTADWNGLMDMNYVFPSAGTYTISVKAMDSNYEWGNEITIANYPIN